MSIVKVDTSERRKELLTLLQLAQKKKNPASLSTHVLAFLCSSFSQLHDILQLHREFREFLRTQALDLQRVGHVHQQTNEGFFFNFERTNLHTFRYRKEPSWNGGDFLELSDKCEPNSFRRNAPAGQWRWQYCYWPKQLVLQPKRVGQNFGLSASAMCAKRLMNNFMEILSHFCWRWIPQLSVVSWPVGLWAPPAPPAPLGPLTWPMLA